MHKSPQVFPRYKDNIRIMKVKKNGFSTPLHPFQILSYILTLLNIFTAALAFPPILPTPAVLVLWTAYPLSQFLVVAFGFIVTRADPTDPLVHASKVVAASLELPNIGYKCHLCDSYVDKTSKHCGQCNRWCTGFDHHCKWTNNCVGSANYRPFIALVVA
jgi:palmitoyltransferase